MRLIESCLELGQHHVVADNMLLVFLQQPVDNSNNNNGNIEQEKPTICGTKAADVFRNFLSDKL